MRNLRAVVRYLRGKGSLVVLCTFPHVFQPTVEATRTLFGEDALKSYLKRCPLQYLALYEGTLRYNELIRRVASEEDVPLIDLDRTYPKDADLFMDYIHQNEAGNAVKARQILEGLRAGPLKKRAG